MGKWFLGLMLLAIAVNAEELVDPTRPLMAQTVFEDVAEVPEQNVDLVIQAVFSSAKGRSAMINGLRYRPGDQLAGSTILDIQDRSVILLSPTGEHSELKMFIPTIKARSNANQGGSL